MELESPSPLIEPVRAPPAGRNAVNVPNVVALKLTVNSAGLHPLEPYARTGVDQYPYTGLDTE